MNVKLELTSMQALALARALHRDTRARLQTEGIDPGNPEDDSLYDDDPALIEVLEKLAQALKQTI